MSSKPVRVCLNCYDKLQKPNATATGGENNKPQTLSSSGEDSEDDDNNKDNKEVDDHDEARFYGDGERNNGSTTAQ